MGSALIVSPELRAATSILKLRSNVRGVFYGQRREPDGTWSDQLVLCVHATENIPPRSMTLRSADLDRAIRRAPTLLPKEETPSMAISDVELVPDVINIGDTYLAIDNRAMASASGPRNAAVTALAPQEDGTTFALLSGHGSLPMVDGQILHAVLFPQQVDSAPLVLLQGTQPSVSGRVQLGGLGDDQPFDWALALFPDLTADGVHNAAGASTPDIPLGTDPLQTDDLVLLWSTTRQDFFEGRVRQVSATPVQFPLPDQQQTSTDYTQVLVITPEDPGRPFSVAGDSGGLIVMRDDPPPRRAVAMVLGGTTQGEISYAVQLRLLAAKFPDALKLFFTF